MVTPDTDWFSDQFCSVYIGPVPNGTLNLRGLPLTLCCMNVFVLLNTEEDILKNVGNRAVLDHSIFFPLLWKLMVPQNSWLQTFFRISSFVFGRTKTSIQVWNYLRVSKG